MGKIAIRIKNIALTIWNLRKRIKIYSKSEAAFREAQTDITPGKNKGLINAISNDGRGNWGR